MSAVAASSALAARHAVAPRHANKPQQARTATRSSALRVMVWVEVQARPPGLESAARSQHKFNLTKENVALST